MSFAAGSVRTAVPHYGPTPQSRPAVPGNNPEPQITPRRRGPQIKPRCSAQQLVARQRGRRCEIFKPNRPAERKRATYRARAKRSRRAELARFYEQSPWSQDIGGFQITSGSEQKRCNRSWVILPLFAEKFERFRIWRPRARLARVSGQDSDAGIRRRIWAPDAGTSCPHGAAALRRRPPPFRLRSGCGGEPGAHAGCLLSASRRAGSQRAAGATPRAHPPRTDGPLMRSTPGTVLRPLPAPGPRLRRRIFCTGSKTMAQAAPCPGWKQAPYATAHPRKAHRPGWV
jgi:hypothetical protein